MVKQLLLVFPFLSGAALLDSHSTAIKQGKSPCDDLKHDGCTSHLGCVWNKDNLCYPRIAWLHVMKCGSSFGTTLAHFANGSLPDESHIPSGHDQDDPEDRTTEGSQGEPNFFKFKYPVNKWFKNVFRNPPNPGNHLPILDVEWDQWRHNWFAIFREPASRVLSSFNHFGQGRGDLLEFAEKIKGQQASMLSAGSAGLSRIRCEFNQTDAPSECKRLVDPDISLAVQRLNQFAFVGIVEEFDMALCLFHKMMGSDCLPIEFVNMREGQYAGGEAMVKKQLATLREKGDPWDDQVYEAAQRRFWGDIRKFDLKPSDCRQLCPHVPSFERHAKDEDSFLIPDGY